jgi:hypothetical protein
MVFRGKTPVIPVSSVPVFKFENSLVPSSRVPTLVIPVIHIIFHINLIKKSSRQGPPLGTTVMAQLAQLARAPGSGRR